MRKGFGLIQALIVIVLVSGILMISMKYASVSIKQTGDLYVKESAELFMDSAVELALLSISGYERNATSHCLSEVSIISSDRRFKADINITDYFLYKDSNDSVYCQGGSGYSVHEIKSDDSHGFVMLQITVETNATHPKNANKKIKLTRRTLQRP